MSAGLTFSTVMDVVIAVLLIATIAYAVSLNRKLAQLRGDKGEMQALIARLVEATEQARQGIEGLRAHAGETGERLQQGLDRSRGQADELAFMIEKAEALSRRLDATLTAARVGRDAPAKPNPSPIGPSVGAGPTAPKPASPKVPVQPEAASLLKTLRGMR